MAGSNNSNRYVLTYEGTKIFLIISHEIKHQNIFYFVARVTRVLFSLPTSSTFYHRHVMVCCLYCRLLTKRSFA